MPKVLVVFYSRADDTARLADAVADGARGVRFTEVDVRRLDGAEPGPAEGGAGSERALRHRPLDDAGALAGYDAIVLGGPVRNGALVAGLTHLLERAGAEAGAGGLVDRVGAVFATTGAAQDGEEAALPSLLAPMARLGMILVPPNVTEEGDAAAGSPFGVVSTAAGGPTEGDLDRARRLGARVARVAEWVRHAKGHEAAGHGHPHHHHHHHH